MTVDDITRPAAQHGFYTRYFRVVALITAALLFLVTLYELRKASVPGAPAGWLYVSAAVAALTLAMQLPPAFFRLPRRGRMLATGMLLAPLISIGIASAQVDEAWLASSEGKQEAANRANFDRARRAEEALEARQASERAATANSLAELEAAKQQLSALNEKLEGCFSSWGHRLSALEEPIKQSLHNPAAFEHIETLVTVPDSDSNNVVMRFRAENRFGALRTAQVRAQLIADDCSVQNIGEPAID